MQIHCHSVICCKTSGRETTRLFFHGVPTSDAWMHILVWQCCLTLCNLPCIAPKSESVASPLWFEQARQCPKLKSHDLLLAAVVINQWFRYWLSLFWLLQSCAWAASWFSGVARAPVSWGGSWNHHSQFGDFFGEILECPCLSKQNPRPQLSILVVALGHAVNFRAARSAFKNIEVVKQREN